MSDQKNIYDIVFIVLLILSSLFIWVIFIAFIIQKNLRSYSNWQIIFLSISTFISCISYLINYNGITTIDEAGYLCKFQGFMMIWSDMSLFIWSALINYSIYYYTIHFDKIQSDIIPWSWWVGDAVIGYFIPFSYSLLIFSTGKIGKNGDYCWIEEGNASSAFNIASIFTYSISWMFMFVNIFFSTKVIVFICRLNKDERDYAKDYVHKLLLFPIIQIFASLPLTIYRILLFFPNEFQDVQEVMKYIGLYGFAGMGIFIGLAFGKNMNIYENVFRCCRKKQRSYSLNDTSLDDIQDGLDLRSSIL